MKKILAITLVLVMVLCTLTACGGSTTPTEEAKENPVEIAKSKLEEAYYTCCEGSKTEYANLGYDKMSLTIDTNPNDTDINIYEGDAVAAIKEINSYLGLPSSLLEKMSNTRAIDGTQSQNCGTYTATWNYHPDSGLTVIYEVNP